MYSVASTSSISSSLTNRNNSPKEKRQANSPLPKPPDVTPDDMYAKVLKKRKYESEWGSNKDSAFSTDHESNISSFHASGAVNIDSTHLKDAEDCDPHNDLDANQGTDEIDGIGMNGCYETLPERKYV